MATETSLPADQPANTSSLTAGCASAGGGAGAAGAGGAAAGAEVAAGLDVDVFAGLPTLFAMNRTAPSTATVTRGSRGPDRFMLPHTDAGAGGFDEFAEK